jgi:hypothetical protein
MRQKNVASVVSRQIANVNQAIPKIKEGIQAVSESPGIAAANNVAVMVQNFLAKFNSGELEAALRSVDLNDWKNAALEGTARIGSGMERKRAVIEEFHRQLQDYQMRYTKDIDGMPSGTLESSRARMNANFDAMSQFRPK